MSAFKKASYFALYLSSYSKVLVLVFCSLMLSSGNFSNSLHVVGLFVAGFELMIFRLRRMTFHHLSRNNWPPSRRWLAAFVDCLESDESIFLLLLVVPASEALQRQ